MRDRERKAIAILVIVAATVVVIWMITAITSDGTTREPAHSAMTDAIWGDLNSTEQRDACNAIALFGVDGVAGILSSVDDMPDYLDSTAIAERMAQHCTR